ncbi:hypothetical protein [Luteolibacter sp. LG18]|uniref:hypothetical protein n=1 Tax=Luteolibacter sp. LG18 TaxID=2819286 RepID=UPI002B2FB0A8|nr:hypothetical protein llg_45070 [Luteolibacter sp. LG18]
MAIEHPFQALFETLGRLPVVHAEPVNQQAYEQLWDLLAVETEHPGRCILLRAPRAGHGKTHLLSRLQHHLGQGHEFIALHAAHGSHIDASTVMADTLARLGRALPAGGGLTVLDLLVRRLFAQALQPLVRSGEVPCQDREGALAALRNRPVETFDFHHPNAVTAHWAKENFEVLGPRLALELAQRDGTPLREVMFWVDALFRFASTPVDHPLRTGALIQAVSVPGQPDAQVFERLATLLDLVSQLVRVVLVADDLEGFSADESSALRLAAFLGSLRHAAGRIDAIVSVNRDIWDSAFLPRLSAGLADRLAEVVVELEPLTRHEIVALLDARAPGLGERVYDRLDLTNGIHHARGILRSAGEAWVQAARQNKPQSKPNHHVKEVPEPELDLPAPEPAHAVTVTPPAAVAAAMAAASAAVASETGDETPPVLARDEVVAHAVEQPVVLPEVPPAPEPVAAFVPAPEPEAIVWNVSPPPLPEPPIPVATVVYEPVVPEAAPVPVATLVPEAAAPVSAPEPSLPSAWPVVDEAPQPSFAPAPAAFHETPLADVLASEAAHEAPPLSWPSPQAAPVGQSSPSPFQPMGESPVPAVVPVFAPTPLETAAVIPPPVPVSPSASPDTPAPETDRVDELLRQFRERYAKG